MVQFGDLKFSTSLGVMYALKQKYNHTKLNDTYKMLANSQEIDSIVEILNISYKRLCGNAEKETVKTWNEVKKEMQKVDSVLASKMVPQCVRLGYCPELKCCGFINSKNYQILVYLIKV